MRGLIVFLIANVCVAFSVAVITMSASKQAAQKIPGTNLIDRRALQEVCESSAAIRIDPKGDFQCSACPSYTDFQGEHGSFNLMGVYQGHFSATNTDQLLLVLLGCESHASGLGGSVLLTRDGTVWKKSAYFKGDKPSKCISFSASDGLDRMVCLGGDGHFGNSALWISAKSYKDNTLREEHLLGIGGNAGGGSPQAGYCYDQDITAFEKLPSDTGFKVVVKQIRGLAPSGADSCGFTEIPMEPEQAVNLSFQFDGDHFAVAPGSKDSLHQVENFVPRQ